MALVSPVLRRYRSGIDSWAALGLSQAQMGTSRRRRYMPHPRRARNSAHRWWRFCVIQRCPAPLTLPGLTRRDWFSVVFRSFRGLLAELSGERPLTSPSWTRPHKHATIYYDPQFD
ncbi:hypothetical protein NDU88_009833 [Pleurodeles waltl]|uniref:Uncharacterized protein n=1 Tax=Pleurodeles waltl TaxID=8319 RepID=A0AAV7QYM3_PLEWA|nr:hypothetical protein NDU88_009833 [Pleurodeles waltl]